MKKKMKWKWSDIVEIQPRERKNMSIKSKGNIWVTLHKHKGIHSQFSPWLPFLLWAHNNENSVCFELTSHDRPPYFCIKCGTVLSKEGEFLTFAKEITQLCNGNSSTIYPLLLYPLLTSVILFITELQTSHVVFLN